jgi:hypothetical protein
MIDLKRHKALRHLASEVLAIRVNGRCMQPQLQHGAVVRVRSAPRYWPGDVVVYRNRQGLLLVHRVLGYYRRRGRWQLLIQADGAPGPDQGARPEQILGRVTDVRVTIPRRFWAISRYLRHAFFAAHGPRALRIATHSSSGGISPPTGPFKPEDRGE